MITEYFIDLDAKVNGTGSEQSPFNSAEVLNTLKYPYSAKIKRGGRQTVKIKLPTMSGQNEQTTITAYGEGPNPVLIASNAMAPVLDSTLVKNLLISGIDFVCPFINYVSENLVYLRANSEGVNHKANVIVEKSTIRYMHPVQIKTKAVYIDAIGGSGIKYRNDTLKVRDVNIYGGHWGVQIHCGSAYDLTGGKTEAYKGRDILIDNVAVIDAVGDGCQVSFANGQGKPVIANCYYRSELYTYPNQLWTASFWLGGCDDAGIEYCESAGSMLHLRDKMGFDIDGRCSGCWVRYCYSHNNGGGFGMFTDTCTDVFNNLAEMESVLIDQKAGNANNTMEYCLSYNDGVSRGGYAGNWLKFTVVRNVVSSRVSNCTFIDTLSKDPAHMIQWGQTQPYIFTKYPGVHMQNNIFYFKHAAVPVNDIGWGNGVGYMKWSNNILYSPEDNGASMIDARCSYENTLHADPLVSFMGNNPPNGFEAAKLIGLLSRSVAHNAGAPNSLPDILGISGNNIGWLQS
ncbi:Uncharacterised protein [Serratia entomophila]|uniref:hypothetical protein n=1 Tax=Serratia entomophila TaxID=42906 RepID=UPI001F446DBB|nr:hypothetical protein [Serratia entomophila]UIW19846.1 hypothetical protein KHA73_07875 [Serratia entomophila]CAI0766766.1 Uncharacterised protein [Serratia entomophila]CAI0770926.1 Uncharacterised protein [Serratia entomophila]CAI0788772.1 Uncharacterised protein [Serratia entomophila]CAI0807953.1 Uncharacterised protein [Serratia entomophila]